MGSQNYELYLSFILIEKKLYVFVVNISQRAQLSAFLAGNVKCTLSTHLSDMQN